MADGFAKLRENVRSVRSMTGTFSTIINFSMLGFLRRLHKLSIKDELQSDTEILKHGIIFPRLERNKRKDGIGFQTDSSTKITNISNEYTEHWKELKLEQK